MNNLPERLQNVDFSQNRKQREILRARLLAKASTQLPRLAKKEKWTMRFKSITLAVVFTAAMAGMILTFSWFILPFTKSPAAQENTTQDVNQIVTAMFEAQTQEAQQAIAKETEVPSFSLTVDGQLQGTLAFIRNDNLWVSINGVEHQLTTDAIPTDLPYHQGLPTLSYSNPQISPDGTMIAYLKNINDINTSSSVRELMISDIDGKNTKQIANEVAWEFPAVRWSRNGQEIYYLVRNMPNITLRREVMAIKSINPITGQISSLGEFTQETGCGGRYPDPATHLSMGENIGMWDSFALPAESNYIIYPTICGNGVGLLDLSTKQEQIVDEKSTGAVISPDGSKVAASSENKIIIFDAKNKSIEKTLPTIEKPLAIFWDNDGESIFYSTSKPVDTLVLDENTALSVFGSGGITFTVNTSTLWKISLSNGENIQILDVDAYHIKPIFIANQKMLAVVVENSRTLFDYIIQGNREKLAENYPSVNLVEIDLATSTVSTVIQKALQPSYISLTEKKPDLSQQNQPPTPLATPEPLDRTNLESVLKWVSYAITENRPEMIADLIGNNGVGLNDRYASEVGFPGFNNSDIVVSELQKGLENTSATCMGYRADIGARPDKASIFFSDIQFRSNNNNITGFILFYQETGWELVSIVPVPAGQTWSNLYQSLWACP
jgi:hypothetical protein